MLTNRQLLNLAEFQYTPFRSRLFYALQLKSDEEVLKIKNMQNEDVRLEDLGNIGTDEGRSSKSDKRSKKDDSEYSGNEDNEEGERKSKKGKRDEEEKKEDEEDEEEEENYDDVEDDPRFIRLLGTQMYIDFAEFAKIMSLFNPNTGIDEKIQFYFRIFDVDQDKKINKTDLEKIMRMLFGSKLKDEDMTTLTDKIFNEVI